LNDYKESAVFVPFYLKLGLDVVVESGLYCSEEVEVEEEVEDEEEQLEEEEEEEQVEN
jgi:hypothetical protein